MKFIIAYPRQQHSFRMSTALKRTGVLYKYLTTIYNHMGLFTSRILKIVI